MKLSIETKVTAAIAIAFVALSIGAIAQEQSEHGTSGPNRFAVINREKLTLAHY